MAPRPKPKPDLDAPIGYAGLSELLGVTVQHLHQLARKGRFPASKSGVFEMKAAVQAYLQSFREDRRGGAGGTASAYATDDAHALKLEELRQRVRKATRENDLEDGLLVDQQLVLDLVEQLVGVVNAELIALPRRLSRDRAVVAFAENEVAEALRRIRMTAQEGLAELRQQQQARHAEGDDLDIDEDVEALADG
jgi:hypothetical protein